MRSITLKWTLAVLGLMMVGLSLLAGVGYSIIDKHYRSYVQSSLLYRADSYADILREDYGRETMEHIAGMEKDASSVVYIFDSGGRLLITSGTRRDAPAADRVLRWSRERQDRVADAAADDGWILAKKEVQGQEGATDTIVLAGKLSWLTLTLDSLQQMLSLAGLGSLLIAGGLSILLSRRIVRPILRMQRATEELAQGKYHVRVPVEGRDELAHLGSGMNRLAESLAYYHHSRREFLSHVAHELRTPLTYLKGYTSLLNDPDILAERKNRVTRVIHEQTERLEHLVNDLMTLSRSDEGQLTLHRKWVKVVPLLEKVLEEVRTCADRLGIRCELEAKEDVVLSLDVHRFHQIMMNLLDNALRYSDPGGQVTVTVRKEGREVWIEIADEGKGMRQKELDLIWERFYRVEKSRSRKHGGSGLGLSIVKNLVEAHGAVIHVESERGRGTTFRMRFPEPGKGGDPA